jgi:hypothetical protein
MGGAADQYRPSSGPFMQSNVATPPSATVWLIGFYPEPTTRMFRLAVRTMEPNRLPNTGDAKMSLPCGGLRDTRVFRMKRSERQSSGKTARMAEATEVSDAGSFRTLPPVRLRPSRIHPQLLTQLVQAQFCRSCHYAGNPSTHRLMTGNCIIDSRRTSSSSVCDRGRRSRSRPPDAAARHLILVNRLSITA